MVKIKIAKILTIITIPVMIFLGLGYLAYSQLIDPNMRYELIFLMGLQITGEQLISFAMFYSIVSFVSGVLGVPGLILICTAKDKKPLIIAAVLLILSGVVGLFSYPPIVAAVLLLLVKKDEFQKITTK